MCSMENQVIDSAHKYRARLKYYYIFVQWYLGDDGDSSDSGGID